MAAAAGVWPSPGPRRSTTTRAFCAVLADVVRRRGRQPEPAEPAPADPASSRATATRPSPWSAGASPAWPRPGSWSPETATAGRLPEVVAARGRATGSGGKLRSAEFAGRHGGPGGRRLRGPPPRGHRAVPELGLADELVAPGAIGRLRVGPGPAPAPARRARPRRAHPVVAARPIRDPVPGRVAARGQDLVMPHLGARRTSSATGRGRHRRRRGSDGRSSSGWSTRSSGGSTPATRGRPERGGHLPVPVAASQQPGSLMRRLRPARATTPRRRAADDRPSSGR